MTDRRATLRIILKNTLTIFNLVNLILALLIISVGAYKNLLFLLVAIANTLISIINSLRAKRIIDKMRLRSEKLPEIEQNGEIIAVRPEELKKGDILILSLGDQILVDSVVESGQIEANESFITGEQDNIVKNPGDRLLSGSFVVAGTCRAKALKTLDDSNLAKLESGARALKTPDSKLFHIINNIVKYISFALIPIGALLLWARFRVPGTTPEIAITSTVAGLISMIPEGLVLLTSSVLALATVRLSRKQVLVQDLYSVETLARVDCFCLDKTGTLTTGRMTVKDLVSADHVPKNALKNALKLILSASTADTATSLALKQKLLKTAKFAPTEQILEIIPFSSDRKYSGVRTKKATYLMGAPEFLVDKTPDFPKGCRVIAIVKQFKDAIPGHSAGASSQNYNVSGSSTELAIPAQSRRIRCDFDDCEPRTSRDSTLNCKLLGYALLEDEIRPNAKNIINYFYKNTIDIKIISGDNLKTVSAVAEKAGVKDLKSIDLSAEKSPDYDKIVKENTIFARVSPAQKKHLVKTLQKQGSTVAMTGDGVNDILAMKEADCAIAIGAGSDAARRSAKLVLMDSDFAAVPAIIDEGRQSINNLERSATLFLSKNTYAAILAVLFILIPVEYPYAPLEMSLLNFVCIGLPGVALALEKNTARVKDQFIKNLKKFAFPTGLIVAIAMLVLSLVASALGLSRPELITLSALITFVIDLVLIYRISRPLTLFRAALFLVIVILFALAFCLAPLRLLFDFAPLF